MVDTTTRTAENLVSTFVEEHRTFMRTLSSILSLLRAGRFTAAQRMADDLDRAVGAHIRFEEEVLYPKVGRACGRAVEVELRSEHSIIQAAIKRLLEADTSVTSMEKTLPEIEAGLQMALRHAESCGTLISHLKTLSAAEQQAAYSHLLQLRAEAPRWTELIQQETIDERAVHESGN